MITQNYAKEYAQNFGLQNLILDGFVPKYPWKFHYCVNFQVEEISLQIKILLAKEDGASSHAHTTNSNSALYFGKLYLILHTPLIAIFQMLK